MKEEKQVSSKEKQTWRLTRLNNHRFKTVTTVRSEAKGQRILDSHPNTPRENLSFVVVEDVAKEGAFDEVRV